MSRDMTRPNWKRTLKRLRRNIAELREFDCEITEPENFDIPPRERVAPSVDRKL
jgi:hypothetical protein